jgi:EAL domain-containing protein (putative c-di-GMP-specific phosphodiesterase class I)
MVPPLEFLPAIASNELEIRIGNWVLETAWKQLVAWHRQGLKLEVSVNISSYHLLWSGFTAYLETILAESPEVASGAFQLEILESTALDDLSAVNRVIKTCRNALGITASLDDFGTGYSSLTHLRHLPVDTVKIDKSFVRDMLDDPDDYAIVESVIGLSHAFNREVVAEGVEHQEQGTLLLLLGCHLAQGYAIAKPMPASELPEWVRNYRPFADWMMYASLELAPEQVQIAIRRIDLRQWLKRVDRCLHSNHNNMAHWPIMIPGKSQLGRWICHAQLHQQYNQQWLTQLTVLHKELLEKGNVLMHQFWNGEAEASRAGFADLQVLQQCLDQYLSEYA